MKFISTRGKSFAKNAAEAITKGLADDGGLFVPEIFPDMGGEFENLLEMDYAETACLVLSKFLTEYDYDQLLSACKSAYSKFENGEPAPLVKTGENFYILELFHGPTLAFKDIALTLLPYLLRKGADLCGIKDNILILVATSGDTGKAALEGFKNADGIKIMVFYPSDGVSDMQKLQMCTQEGDNVNVVAVKGNFDDCQTAVKNIFSSAEAAGELKKRNCVLSSANSINFGRLAPQIAYYFSAYFDLVSNGEIKLGDKINFVVPTGNFGNILAGYYAKRMGLPVDKLVCASNSNNVLTEFFSDGEYNADREFYKTMSPSMDILISSNLERLVFELSGRDADITSKRMAELKKEGRYNISQKELNILEKDFFADYCDEDECRATISGFFEECGYVLDPHTSVAVDVADSFLSYSDSKNATVILSTASPYKFSQNVLYSITGKNERDPFKAADKLSKETAEPVPDKILELKNKSVRFNGIIEKSEALRSVIYFAEK